MEGLKKPTRIPKRYGRKKSDEPARKPSNHSQPSSSYKKNSNPHELPPSRLKNASRARESLARHENKRHLLPAIN
jgi:hypothetical protein